MGFARATCQDEEIRTLTKELQRELFKVGSAIATPAESRKPVPEIPDAMVERLTSEVQRLEAMPGVIGDWTIPGEDPCSAAFDVARTICRRVERLVVGLIESGIPIQPSVLAYINRLSDLLWLFSRVIECRQGLDAKLRTNDGPRWSRAW
jgi:cob(I)alamin adenosyltransferase